MTTAAVVGSGPNGLASAIHLAQHGVSVTVYEMADVIGGGMRTSEHTLPGVLHDDCAAFHPTGVASPFFQSLPLEEHGLTWLWPEVELAHPLDGGVAAVMYRDVDRSAALLGADEHKWKRTFGTLVNRCDDLLEDALSPVVRWPSHPVLFARFGLSSVPATTWTARRFTTPEARALFGGVAAHALVSLRAPFSSAVGMMLTTVGHAYGWPVVKGGTQELANALASYFVSLGGTIHTGIHVASLSQLPAADIVMLDTSPTAAVSIVGEKLPKRVSRAYGKYVYGPGAYKVDFAVRGDVPWANTDVKRAGTVHCGGTFEEIVEAEQFTSHGKMPARPFVLVGQQYLADPSRSHDGVNPIWAYAHVPHGFDGDATDAIISQIERFAPGFRERIVGMYVRNTTDMAAYNPNYIGGDIAVGANTMKQMIMRPRVAVNPYATGARGVFMCSSATPPGGGVHGMCGLNAARAALRAMKKSS
jgi:phytoene dehydrogenase-like protein